MIRHACHNKLTWCFRRLDVGRDGRNEGRGRYECRHGSNSGRDPTTLVERGKLFAIGKWLAPDRNGLNVRSAR